MGGRSRAAAQLLAGKGLKEVYNLKGGIKAWGGHIAAGPADMTMIHLRGDETPQEIIVLAYGMEMGLGGFYQIIAEKMNDSDTVGVLTKLGGVEEKHKQRLFDLYLTLEPTVADKKAFESEIVSEVMEGGFTTEEFLAQNRDSLKTVPDVLDIAMMLETQSLDLYMRYSQKVKDDKSKTVLYDLGEEEKAHLKALGRLMESKIQ